MYKVTIVYRDDRADKIILKAVYDEANSAVNASIAPDVLKVSVEEVK